MITTEEYRKMKDERSEEYRKQEKDYLFSDELIVYMIKDLAEKVRDAYNNLDDGTALIPGLEDLKNEWFKRLEEENEVKELFYLMDRDYRNKVYCDYQDFLNFNAGLKTKINELIKENTEVCLKWNKN